MLGGTSVCVVGMYIAVLSSQSMTTVPGSKLICLNCEAFRVISCSFRFAVNIITFLSYRCVLAVIKW